MFTVLPTILKAIFDFDRTITPQVPASEAIPVLLNSGIAFQSQARRPNSFSLWLTLRNPISLWSTLQKPCDPKHASYQRKSRQRTNCVAKRFLVFFTLFVTLACDHMRARNVLFKRENLDTLAPPKYDYFLSEHGCSQSCHLAATLYTRNWLIGCPHWSRTWCCLNIFHM